MFVHDTQAYFFSQRGTALAVSREGHELLLVSGLTIFQELAFIHANKFTATLSALLTLDAKKN